MYLGLFPSQWSDKVLRECFENTLDEKLHLTIIHTPRSSKIDYPLDLKTIGVSSSYFDLVVDTSTVDKFGKDKDMWVLRMQDTELQYLSYLRKQVEKWFNRNHFSFSDEFTFNPHITLTKDEVLKMKGPIPKVLVFDRIEWVL